MLEAYVDESGTDEPWCTVAALVGLASDWRSFEGEWGQVIRTADVDCFHATKFFHGAFPFDGWPRDKREAFIDALTSVLVRYDGIKLVASAVDTHAFFARNEHERTYLTGGRWADDKWRFSGAPSRPYYLPLCYVFDKCYRTATRLDMFHDQHNVYAEHALRLHGHAKLHRQPAFVRDGIGSLTFGSKRDYLPLQAADLAAYLTFRRVAFGKQSADTLIGRASQTFGRFGEMILIYDEKGIDSHLRAALPQAIRDGRMRSQLRTVRRKELGRQRQREQQEAKKKR